MAHQCRSCGRDLNNNYTPYSSGYPNANNGTNHDRQQQQQQSSYNTRSSSVMTTTSSTTTSPITSPNQNPKSPVTAKVMFGSVGGINDLREKEKTRNGGTTGRTGRRN